MERKVRRKARKTRTIRTTLLLLFLLTVACNIVPTSPSPATIMPTQTPTPQPLPDPIDLFPALWELSQLFPDERFSCNGPYAGECPDDSCLWVEEWLVDCAFQNRQPIRIVVKMYDSEHSAMWDAGIMWEVYDAIGTGYLIDNFPRVGDGSWAYVEVYPEPETVTCVLEQGPFVVILVTTAGEFKDPDLVATNLVPTMWMIEGKIRAAGY